MSGAWKTCSADRWDRSRKTRRSFHTIHPDGQALETMADPRPGPYASLDAASSEIETHTRGVCALTEHKRSLILA